jgi:NAD(P)-dependent dehydrogenase (short-subunit alcohol dehydrogenase family)
MGIRVNAVCPGQIRTDLEKWRFGLEAKFFATTVEAREQEMCKTIPLGHLGEPAEAGRLVAFLASDAAGYITGQAINLDGGQCMEL